MGKNQGALMKVIGREVLFPLGGFVAETARDEIKSAWKESLNGILHEKNMWDWDCYESLLKLIYEKIDEYSYEESKPDLYAQVKELIDSYLSERKDSEGDMSEDGVFENEKVSYMAYV